MIWKEWIIVGIILISIGLIKEFYSYLMPQYMTTIIGIGMLLIGYYLNRRNKSTI